MPERRLGPGRPRPCRPGFDGAAPVLCVAAALVAACSGGPRPATAPPPPTPGASQPAAPAATKPAPPPPPPVTPAPTRPAPEIVIEPTEPDPEEKPTLAEAAQRERRRRRQAGEPMIVITDANLSEHAVGELTFIEDEPAASAGGADADAAGGPDEQFWRDRVRTIRQRWADAAARAPELEERVAELRRRFYETDDAYYRDTRIKTAWDRAIDLVAQTRAEAETHRAELQQVIEEGRLAGALPGWLREGIELEPTPEEPEPDGYEPGEPVVVEPGEGRTP